MVSQQMMSSRWGFRKSAARIPSVMECFVLILSQIYSASCKSSCSVNCKSSCFASCNVIM
jgi:hypothetical protein